MSCGGSVVVIQQSAQTLPSFHCPTLSDMGWVRADQLVLDTLMVAFDMIVRGEFGCGATERALTKQNQAVQARFFNRAHETLGVGIQVRTPWWQFHRFYAGFF